jgi:Outer membrane receptor proteins, mostly Fe transport
MIDHIAFVGALMTGATVPAAAQDQPDTVEISSERASPDGAGLEDIVVTAQRREERLQDVPIAMTALSGDALEQSGITNTQQLTQAIPNLVMTSAGSSYQAVIRGVGTRGVTQGDESNVALYVDGVYQPDQTAANFEFLGIQRVEVLRGPQGTLFGRNATGGLINIVTLDPSFTPSLDAELSYGRFDEVVGKMRATTGLTDSLAIDLRGLYRSDRGYVYNIFRKRWENPRDARAIRGKLLFEPNDSVRLLVSGGYSYSNDPTSMANSPLDGNFSARAQFPGILIPGEYQVAVNEDTVNKKRILDASIQASFDMGPAQLNSVTSYQRSRSHYVNDNDGSQIRISYLDLDSEVETFTQELRINSNHEGPLQWVGGLFAFHSTSGYRPIVFCCTAPDGTGTPRAALRTEGLAESIAFFADGTYELTEKLSLIGGVRISFERRRHDFLQTSAVSGMVQASGRLQKDFDDISPRASLRYKINDESMIFFTYSRGFKSGVYNASSVTQSSPVDPETIDAFEFGLKSDPLQWLRLNASVFYYKYKDIQLSARDSRANSVLLLNAADSTIKGAEAELALQPTRNLDLRMSGTYLDAKYDRFPGAVVNNPLPQGGNSQTIVDLRGTHMIRAPRTTFTLGADYHRQFGDGSEVGASGNIYHTAKYYWDFNNRLTVPAYTMVNASIYYELPGGNTRFTIWGRNLANAVVPQQLLPSTTMDNVTYEPPRTYGVSIRQQF